MSRSTTPDAESGSGHDAATPLEVGTDRVDGALVVHVAGEIDMNTAPSLGESLAAAFADAAEAGNRAVVVDFGGVGFLASIGLSVLVAHHQTGIANGTPMHLVVSSRAVRRSITSAELDRLFTMHASVEDALRTVAAR